VSHADITGFHGTNAKISIDNFGRATETHARHSERLGHLALAHFAPETDMAKPAAALSTLDIRRQVSPEEWSVRQDLAAAYRLVAL
jgi:hypothetical protein